MLDVIQSVPSVAQLEMFNSKKCFDLINQGQQLYKLSNQMLASFEVTTLHMQIKEVVERNYNLGEVIGIYEIFSGYINRSFGIYCTGLRSVTNAMDVPATKLFLRKYKKGITEKEILFEHSLIEFSIANGFNYGANVIRDKLGNSFVKEADLDYYAIYRFLDGDDKYSWDNPDLNDEECASAAEVLAIFHNSVTKFNPHQLGRVEPKIMELLNSRGEVFKKFASPIDLNKKSTQGKFHRYYLKKIDSILTVLKNTILPEKIWKGMPLNPCHNDYHPGNLKFKNNQVIGVFDFDWSKIDLRLFDLCLAVVYCCSCWEDPLDGHLLLDKSKVFLKTYQVTLDKLKGLLPPLTFEEKKHFSTLMAAANLYLVNWDVCAYYGGSNLNEYEYLTYLQHNVRLMEWIETHKELLDRLVLTV